MDVSAHRFWTVGGSAGRIYALAVAAVGMAVALLVDHWDTLAGLVLAGILVACAVGLLKAGSKVGIWIGEGQFRVANSPWSTDPWLALARIRRLEMRQGRGPSGIGLNYLDLIIILDDGSEIPATAIRSSLIGFGNIIPCEHVSANTAITRLDREIAAGSNVPPR